MRRFERVVAARVSPAITGNGLVKLFRIFSRLFALVAQTVLVAEQIHQQLSSLTHILPLILSQFSHVLKLPQRPNLMRVGQTRPHHLFRSIFDQVVEQQQRFVYMAPIFAIIVEPLPYCVHHNVELLLRVR